MNNEPQNLRLGVFSSFSLRRERAPARTTRALPARCVQDIGSYIIFYALTKRREREKSREERRGEEERKSTAEPRENPGVRGRK